MGRSRFNRRSCSDVFRHRGQRQKDPGNATRVCGNLIHAGVPPMMIPLVLVACLPTIWIVDSANGPGAHFTDLPAAIAAAASGDTLVVRAGAYMPFIVS